MTYCPNRFFPALICAALTGLAPSSPAQELTAFEIMQRVEDRDDGDNVTQEVEMILIDRKGNRRTRVLASLRREVGDDTHSILFFLSPPDVRNSAFLTWDYDAEDQDDDQWLYLPALKKTKRIAGSDKSGSFMGSDFTYADMTSRPLGQYTFKIMAEPDVRGAPTWQIESLPNPDEIERTGYRRSILFVRKDNFMVVRGVHWQQKGGITKYLDIKEMVEIDGIWVATELHMTSRKGQEVRHRTVLFNRDTRFDAPLSPDWFTMGQLEKGPPHVETGAGP